MAKSIIGELADFGQSIWVDDISRAMMADGSLQRMIDLGLRGMTSNLTIFDKAIKESDVYNRQLKKLCACGKDAFQRLNGKQNDLQINLIFGLTKSF